jgi:hypothetical protein
VPEPIFGDHDAIALQLWRYREGPKVPGPRPAGNFSAKSAIVLSDQNLDAVIVHNGRGTSRFGSERDDACAIAEGIDPDCDRPETS